MPVLLFSRNSEIEYFGRRAGARAAPITRTRDIPNGTPTSGGPTTRPCEIVSKWHPRTAIPLAVFTALGWATSLAAADSAGSISDRPFLKVIAAPAKTMFVQLSPESTGVKTENRYDDPKMRNELYQEFETSSIGTGVAIGDYDGDGRPDIFVVSKTETCRLFRNLGDWKFEDVTEKAGVGDKGNAAKIWKQGATFVDVNNDGRLDLYVCRTRAPNLLYINQGDGTFKESAAALGLDVNDSSVMAAFCDYDRDGWLDVYIATNILDIAKHPNGQRGYMFHNNGNGTFSNVTDRAGIAGEAQSHSATWWDYDNDGWPDLYVAYDYGLADKLYHNNRNGTFTDALDQALPHTSFSSMGADLGDVNNDGLIDFFVADMAATTHQTDQHSLADARGRTEERPDTVTASPKYHRNALLLNTGTGRCLEGAFLAGVAATDWTWSSRLEDLDNDGRLDLVVTNGFPRDPGVDVLKRLMGAEGPAERIKIMYESPAQAEVNLALRNRGDLAFENVSAAWGLDQKGVSFGAAFGDLGGTGNLDLVYSNYQGGVTVLRNDNSSGHRVVIELRGTASNRFGVGAIVRVESALGLQAQQLVLARGYMSNSEPVLHFGLGEEKQMKRVTIAWPSGHVQSFENLPVDRRFTITEPTGPAVAKATEPTPAARGMFAEVGQSSGLAVHMREEPLNESSAQKLLPRGLNRRGPALAVGDIDGSGRDSIVVGGTTLDPARILKPTASSSFAADSGFTSPAGALVNDGPVLLFDANGDGAQDLLITKGGNALPPGAPEYEPQLYLNDGHGAFRTAVAGTLPPVSTSVGAVAAADVDHDGHLDLFIGGRVLNGQYPFSPPSSLLLNRGGKFEDITDAVAPVLRTVGMVTSALWTDVDGDGWSDLLIGLDWGTVKYFHNDHGKAFDDWSEKTGFAAAGTGWWTGIAAADFNGDGRPDYAVGNVGLNTQYTAEAKHPQVIVAGDFKGGGSLQLVEGYYEGDRLYPWRSRRELAAVLPAIMKRFPKNDYYARATLGEILGEDKLAKAQRFVATEMKSGVFMSQSDGTYRFEPLPRIAQIAPLQGMVAGDFNGDGHADLYAVQNSYAPIAAVGRFDGGLSQLLCGDGRGHLTAVTPAESNLIAPGDAKALAVADLNGDGWPDFVVTQNNATSLAFENRRTPAGHSVRVALRGTAGNPMAIGAHVTIEYTNATSLTAEVYAGSGYYSQSTAALFFGYRDDNPPKGFSVRWPSGETSRHAYSAGEAHVVLKQPAR